MNFGEIFGRITIENQLHYLQCIEMRFYLISLRLRAIRTLRAPMLPKARIRQARCTPSSRWLFAERPTCFCRCWLGERKNSA